ncbi:MAG: sel1 repeat family protein, partial [Chloroflexi bacterium]|nr:sel1 repeat family protein [Chloroflexota bacterium]
KDSFEASKWMHKAAELNHAGAQAKLGYLYTQGIAVQQNYELAFQWFSKAARQGDINGQYNLGIFYLNGWGAKQDKTMAAQYLAAASAQGDESAEQMLQGLLLPQQQQFVPDGLRATHLVICRLLERVGHCGKIGRLFEFPVCVSHGRAQRREDFQ